MDCACFTNAQSHVMPVRLIVHTHVVLWRNKPKTGGCRASIQKRAWTSLRQFYSKTGGGIQSRYWHSQENHPTCFRERRPAFSIHKPGWLARLRRKSGRQLLDSWPPTAAPFCRKTSLDKTPTSVEHARPSKDRMGTFNTHIRVIAFTPARYSLHTGDIQICQARLFNRRAGLFQQSQSPPVFEKKGSGVERRYWHSQER